MTVVTSELVGLQVVKHQFPDRETMASALKDVGLYGDSKYIDEEVVGPLLDRWSDKELSGEAIALGYLVKQIEVCGVSGVEGGRQVMEETDAMYPKLLNALISNQEVIDNALGKTRRLRELLTQ